MIFDAIINIFGDIMFGVLDWLPDPGFPSFISDTGPGTLDGALQFFVDNIGPMSGWVNLTVLFSSVTVLIGLPALMGTTRTLIAWFNVVKPG